MIAHVVLFRTRADLAAKERDDLIAAFETALRDIPSIRRARVGPRVVHGRSYAALMKEDYPYAAIIEFDDLRELTAYLDHPAHGELAARFFSVLEVALFYDFDLNEDGSYQA